MDHDLMHGIINDDTSTFVVYRVDGLVKTIIFISILVLYLTAMPAVVEEVRIVGSCIVNKPLHGCDDVSTSRHASGVVLLIICESDGVLLLESISLNDKGLDVPHIIDASPKLVLLTNVVDPDEECSLATLTVG